MPKIFKNNIGLLEYILVSLAIVVLVALATQIPQPNSCTEEAMVCPDGSAVGRTGPDCEFSPCPNCRCPFGYVQEGSTCNPQCYYSEPQCMQPSLQCTQETTYCTSDDDCIPAECCHPSSCINSAFKEVCDLACTASCEGPLDCGAGSCGCVNNMCVVSAA